MNIELINKLWKRTEVINGHWLWIGALNNGHCGVTRYDRATHNVARLSLHIYLGLSLKGNWVACHIEPICMNSACWNPLHLYKGTYSSNQYDAVKLGSHHNANKTHCKWGHKYTPENTILVKRWNNIIERACKECARISKEKQRIKLYAKS